MVEEIFSSKEDLQHLFEARTPKALEFINVLENGQQAIKAADKSLV